MLRYLITAALLMIALSSQAQPDANNGGAIPVPIDGGASLLLAGGAGFILRKLRQRRRTL